MMIPMITEILTIIHTINEILIMILLSLFILVFLFVGLLVVTAFFIMLHALIGTHCVQLVEAHMIYLFLRKVHLVMSINGLLSVRLHRV
jgi:hypothetical protein